MSPACRLTRVNVHRGPLGLDLGDSSTGDAALIGLVTALGDRARRARGQPAQQEACALHSLQLDGCYKLTHTALALLPISGATAHLRSLNVSGLRPLGAGPSKRVTDRPLCGGSDSSLLSDILRAAPELRQLQLDELSVPHTCLQQLAASCTQLESLSLMGCRDVCDAGLALLAAGCPQLRSLTIGGANGRWTEAAGLAAFTQLSHLSLARRGGCTDAEMSTLLSSLTGLASLRLAGLSRVSDEGLAGVTRLSALSSLVLVCCDGLQGAWLGSMRTLHVLRLRHCPAVLPRHLQVRLGFASPSKPCRVALLLVTSPKFAGAGRLVSGSSCLMQLWAVTGIDAASCVQAVALCCRRLQVLELPGHVSPHCLPVQAAGHLAGIRVESQAAHAENLRRRDSF